ncbi:acyltransferase [Caenimonas sedimenti]|uniref:Acyltransferase n=1 Tax=Caenimonas sedimenti TaxID=2596921 RepID=A0A562ZXT2_9BURK|nr:acyltransferase [Caenimonas sedimenti]TWO73196.1 acyltransferase [Caenimonas sedimenti]
MYRNIQLLRAAGALLVFLHHVREHYANIGGTNPVLKGFMDFGYAGVDLFFVISGFIMMHLITDGPEHERVPWKFLGRRLVRIYFWYWPCLLLGYVQLLLAEPGRLAQVSVLDSIFLTSITPDRLIIFVSWSLSYELLFYAATSLLLFVRATWVPRIVTAALTLQIAYTVIAPYQEGTFLAFLVSPFNIEFLMGCQLFFWRRAVARYGHEVLLLALAAFFIWLGVRFAITSTLMRVPSFGLGALFIVALALRLEARGRFVAGRALVAAGEASYTLYLTHLAFISVFVFADIGAWLARIGGLGREIGFLAFVLAMVWLCIIVNRHVEMPLVRWGHRLFRLNGSTRRTGNSLATRATIPP